MKNENSLMTFPCDFQIKVIGNNNETFLSDIIRISRKYYPIVDDKDIQSQLSKQGNYLAITIALRVEDQQTLDSLYMELTKHTEVKMVL